MRNPAALLVVALSVTAFISSASRAAVGTWIGPTGTGWNDSAHWQGTIPNGQGDTAQYVAGGSQVTLQDNTSGVTVGTLKMTGTGNASWQITPNSNVFLNQDGTGPLSASVINDIQTTGGSGNVSIWLNPGSAGTFVLQDDLFISNTSNSSRSNGSIQIRGPLKGTGNIWIENVSNNIAAGQIQFTADQSTGLGTGGFGGNITVAKGATTFTRGDVFSPTAGKSITIGAAGKGDVTLAFTGGGLGNMENNFIVAAGTGGTSVFAANASAVSNNNVQIKTTFSNAATIRLDGDLNLDNRATNGSVFIIGDIVHGDGKLTTIGPGPVRITNTNSYKGGTFVNNGSLVVGYAPEFFNGYGTHAATNGTLGTGNVTVNSTATKLQIESTPTEPAGITPANVIADTATLRLAGCDSAFAGCASGGPLTADGGYIELGAGIDEKVAALLLSTNNGLSYVAQQPGTYGATGSGATHILDEYFAGAGILTVAPVGLPGDFNGDGKVDAGDYATWRKNEIANTPLANDNGVGNQSARYNLWRANFGSPPGSGSELVGTAIPEPGTLLLALSGVLSACLGRRRR